MQRRQFLSLTAATVAARRPNILFAISDDQSWLHTSAAGDAVVQTPAFDAVAKRGALFTNAFSTCPGCAPSRASILTGRSIWELEEAGTHASLFPKHLTVFPDLLARAGYHTGLTGKGAGPCNFKAAGWPHNPAGPSYDGRKLKEKPPLQIDNNDYAANFEDFLDKRQPGQPFYFWYGCHEPHRGYTKGSGAKSGKDTAKVQVPAFLPDTPEMRSDLLDYYLEIEHFDQHLGRMLRKLEDIGELDNTLVVACADNGMSFPRAKANLYEYGIHLPLAIAWPAAMRGGRRIDDLVSYRDFAPTFLEAAGIQPPAVMTGASLVPILKSSKSGIVDGRRAAVAAGRERHSHARFDNLGYPCRALRTRRHLYIRNFHPSLWPAGDPPLYADIDNGPSKTIVMSDRGKWHELSLAKRPAEELYDIQADPGCLQNLAADAKHARTLAAHRAQLEAQLRREKDPRVLGNGHIFDTYPRYSPMRPELGGFATEGAYNPNPTRP
jgi:N-sulfoglucosamine sulfohydrolase